MRIKVYSALLALWSSTFLGCEDTTDRAKRRGSSAILSTLADQPGDEASHPDKAAPEAEASGLLSATAAGFLSSEGPIYISAKHSGKCLAITKDLTTDIISTIQQECREDKAQSWHLVRREANQYQIYNEATRRCLFVHGDAMDDATLIGLGICEAKAVNQRWEFNNKDATYEIKSVLSGKCLDVAQASLADSTPVIQYSCHGQNNQLWSKGDFAGLPKSSGTTSNAIIKTNYRIDQNQTPEITVEFEGFWAQAHHGSNWVYSDFFTPLAHFKGSTYFIWINEQSRPHVAKITDGRAIVRPLDPDQNYRTQVNPHNQYSLGVDKNGYIHILGDMQNYTGSDSDYLPKYRNHQQLYWISKLPEDIDEFAFAGGRGSPSAIPASRFNGDRFFTDNNGELYVSGCVEAITGTDEPGRSGLGLYRYQTATRSWQALGAVPPLGNPQHRRPVLFWGVGGNTNPKDNPSWQGFFNFIKVDTRNNLHFAPTININNRLPFENRLMYAVSSDGGQTWKRANGSTIPGFPLRAEDGEANQADLVLDVGTDRKNGLDFYSSVAVDKQGQIGISAKHPKRGNERTWYSWDGRSRGEISALNGRGDQTPIAAHMAPDGSLVLVDGDNPAIIRQNTFNETGKRIEIPGYDRLLSIDEYTLRTTGVIYAVGVNTSDQKQAVIRITFK